MSRVRKSKLNKNDATSKKSDSINSLPITNSDSESDFEPDAFKKEKKKKKKKKKTKKQMKQKKQKKQNKQRKEGKTTKIQLQREESQRATISKRHVAAKNLLQQATASHNVPTNFKRRGVMPGDVRGSYLKNHVLDSEYPTRDAMMKFVLQTRQTDVGAQPLCSTELDYRFVPPLTQHPNYYGVNESWNRKVLCPYKNETGCYAQFKLVYNADKDVYQVWRKCEQSGQIIPHSHHGFKLRRGVPRIIKAELTPERVKNLTPLRFIALLKRLPTTQHLRIQGED